ncbi:carbohydrate ABC transporter permease [Paenibacillus sacheonensis]|uniref:ABC transporter permease subunit n=1 Tax=Paenibacillus sacheonensis TaxID=742054 RepID=A0A7X4YVM2_9BACL|nr:carbohydrate ABC transporter permease [Paenibacillus sacheonensis]MBM7569472.1 putative aldouronate transport system permease protein [Paenibacillus sacheonensis]NBC73360.1 ABC transporter permease subunit [Paenibacillus sacheonensis]
MHHRSFGGKLFEGFNYVFLVACALLCIFPIIHVFAVSFSSSTAAASGQVTLWPVGFNLSSYKYALNNPQFLASFLVTLKRVALGVSVNMLLTIFAAYPLSKERGDLFGRNVYSWYLFITIIFSGGLIPWYMTVNQLGLMDSVWALILPGALPVFNVLILLNFFRQLPKEIGESAFIDGAGHWSILGRIYLPLSKPALATLVLFTCVGHWNSWFDGLILMSSPHHYPLQSYLQTIIVNRDMSLFTTASQEELKALSQVSDRTLKSAQIFIAAAPILAVYPFLQKYFMKGIVMGSVKG